MCDRTCIVSEAAQQSKVHTLDVSTQVKPSPGTAPRRCCLKEVRGFQVIARAPPARAGTCRHEPRSFLHQANPSEEALLHVKVGEKKMVVEIVGIADDDWSGDGNIYLVTHSNAESLVQ